jgi:hypothetical protein
MGTEEDVQEIKEGLKSKFDCDDVGEMKDYVGVKLDQEGTKLKATQPVLLQSFKDEFDLSDVPHDPVTPAPAGTILQKDDEDFVGPEEQKKFRSGVGKLLHMMKWSRPDILNRTRELSRFMSAATKPAVKAMHILMKYCLSTPNRGLVIDPDCTWDGDPNFEFVVKGRTDSDFSSDPETRKSVTAVTTFLCGAVVTTKSKMQKCVTISVTEAEFVAGCEGAQDMLFIMRLLESMGLKVQKPMILEMDNKGAVDLTHSWSSTGRTRHIANKLAFLRELKEEGIIECRWISNEDMSSDIFTKNVGGADFQKHLATYVGHDEYMND